ncbi:hypothetical protein TTHERM_00355630 (macronuclear) [Tetrahymena thermophila SB210]|uniref:Kinase domain protein n=1 Tax=Tetrahymena thermophila (strain SB210) TaxID=312017 RepID=Q22Y08_TETTS|nr:hypothetical protein TTHERM_00355630 [Tetrahymena thermophila SB210]EAR90216.2 hypothetical protein TTHERM_00355630 [Tetrahymena thermophila SB210]|eukprot:XP_001010461.2 hypothetical protein TTHERM_00355630 [Tetrahymena thermophila SB210]
MRRLKEIVNHKKLNKTFDLVYENIKHGQNYQLLISAMEQIQELQSFDLILGSDRPSHDQNEIKEQGAIIISEQVAKSQILEKIYIKLNKNNIGNQGVFILFEGISKSQKIKTIKIDLTENDIEDIGLSYLGQSIKNLPQLQSLNLNLSKNQISIKGIEQLFEELIQCKSLTYLTLNIIEDLEKKNIIHAKQIGEYLSKCKNLKYFSLFLEKVRKSFQNSQCDCKDFSSQIRMCDQITFLDIQIIGHIGYYQNNKSFKLFKIFKLARLVQFKHKIVYSL